MAQSAALSRALVFGAAVLLGGLVGGESAKRLSKLAREAWGAGEPGSVRDAGAWLALAADTLGDLLRWPLLLLAGAALLAGALQVGPLLAPRRLAPRLDRLNPGAGLKRMLSLRSLAFLGLATLTAAAMAWLTADLLLEAAPVLAHAPGQPLPRQVDLAAELLGGLAWRAAAVLVVFGALDYLVARRAHRRQQQMTPEEVRREQREQEGDPAIRGRRREVHRELAARDTLAAAGRADVLVVGDGRAVALRYAPPDDPAPWILCVAAGDEARRVQAAAARAAVPRITAPTLAADLCRAGEDRWLPEALFDPVAEIYRGLKETRGSE